MHAQPPAHTDPRSHRLPTGRRLDLTACLQFHRAADLLVQHAVERVVVDLRATRQVFDSGLALLIMLHRNADAAEGIVVLENCAPEVTRRLRQAGMHDRFEIG